MRRLRARDWLLVGTLVALWLVSLGLHVRAGLINADAGLPIYASSAPSAGYPRIDYVWRGAPEATSVALGDRVIRLGDEDLRGVTAAGFRARAYSLAHVQPGIPLVVEHGGERVTVQLRLVRSPYWWSLIPFSAGLALTALLLLIRAPSWPLSGFVVCLLFSINAVSFRSLGGLAAYAQAIMDVAAVPLAAGLLLWNTFEGSEARRPVRAWQAGLALGFAALFAGWYLWAEFLPLPASALGHLVTLDGGLRLAFVVSWFFAIAWAARRMSKLERRKGLWIGLGIYLGCLPYAALALSVLFGIPAEWEMRLAVASRLAQVAIPLGILISVVAYHWLDVDRLIGASATYTLLGIALLGGALVLVPPIARAASDSVGIDAATGQVTLSLAIAGIAVPLYRAVRPWADRILLSERYALDRGFEALVKDLPSAHDAAELTRMASERLDALLRPESCVAYARARGPFEPVFVRGAAVPPAFVGNSPLIGALSARVAPLVSRRFSARDRREALSPFDRAALETLGAAVVLPVHRRGGLVAFLCLGPKRSGDIYPSSDIALLGAVAGAISTQLDRFEDAEVVREARAMQQELRRYVPGAVARGLEAGDSLEPREQVVSVLFVDIRGYATYAESRAPHEIFSTVNRYTTAVSAVVEKHGGAVVEFNGDGMMTVFGAPSPLADKERAAVRAAREIVEHMPALGAGGSAERLSVGVGVATGMAFVGSVQAVDRSIWTALGNTTNLAARLQALTRELEASIVIDTATQRSAGDAAAGFERREQVQIRGRSQREDLYLLPINRETDK
jgi:class 3 adenylate cyclase